VRVRSDASFIVRSNEEGMCNGHGSKCKYLEESWAGRYWLQSPYRMLYKVLNTVRAGLDRGTIAENYRALPSRILKVIRRANAVGGANTIN
jgi:hypothetical protein